MHKDVIQTPERPGRTIADWQSIANPEQLQSELTALIERIGAYDNAWIAVAGRDEIARQLAHAAERKAAGDPMTLFGVPFAVKDNIDVVRFETTAGCPAFAYRPDESATVVRRLTEAGAICIGKTNLDQFATGLVGTRSPYGAVANCFDAAYVSGGSSSGSASVVARGLVPFALGTDTAGSGRVPAGANNIVGLKPTRGTWSAAGLVPACRTLDCITVLALTIADALAVDDVVRGADPADPLSRSTAQTADFPARLRLGIPRTPRFFGDANAEAAWRDGLARIDAELVEMDFAAFEAVAALLYDGPWVAERLAAIEPFFVEHADAMDPVVRGIIGNASRFSAADAFRGQYRLAALAAPARALLDAVDALLVPTVPAHPTIAAVAADPITLNSRLGTYTNFVNLLDWSAVAFPAGFRADGLPFGMTLIGPAFAERRLAVRAAGWVAGFDLPLGATGRRLNHQEPLS